MGTTWAAKIADAPSLVRVLVEATILKTLDSVIQKMSPWEANSDIQRFSKAEANTWVPLAEDTFYVLEKALAVSDATKGRYDPTFAHAIDLLGFGPSQYVGYDYQSANVSAALAQANYKALELDHDTHSVLQPGGFGFDLCSIAKGYAVDKVAETLEAKGFTNFYFEIGGEARGLGCKPTGEPWVFSIDRPTAMQDAERVEATSVALCGISLATSGNYHQFRVVNGHPIGHLVSLNRNAKNSLYSVSVLSDKCIDADAYASALYLLGEADGFDFAVANGLAAIFFSSIAARLTPKAAEMLD